MKPILIIKTGNTLKSVPRARGDFEHWIMAGMKVSPAAQFVICDVAVGEPLPSRNGISAVVVTGSGAMVSDRLAWSEYTSAYLREAAENTLPVLGICYGHQLLAQAFGGIVDYHPNGREIGTTVIKLMPAAKNDSLFKDFPEEFSAHVSHRQTITRLPAGAEVLAANDFEPHQAVRFRNAAWGVQFHPEFAEDIIRIYLAEREQALRAEGLNVTELHAKVTQTPVAEQVLQKFARLVCDHHV